MLSLILTPLGTFIGWSVIPGFLSSRLQRITYKAFPSYRPSSPAQASKHAKVAYVLIVCIYLIYTLVNSYRTVLFDDPNPYHVLDMPVYRSAHLQGEAWDALLKEQWRFLARTNHPDKSNGSEEASIGFVKLRLAYEILIDPTTRAAHDRFGPSVIRNCAEKCNSYEELWTSGLQTSLGFYAPTITSLLLLTLTGSATYGAFWRYLSLIALFALEFTLLCQPQWQVSIVERLPFFSDLTLAQIIRVLRQLYVLLNFALSQVGPVLFPSDTKSEETTRKDLHKVMPSLLRLEAAITASQSDMQQLSLSDLKPLLQMSVASSTKDPSTDLDRVTFELKNAMVDTLCEGKLKSSEESRQVWIDAVRRNTAASESDVRHLHHDECVHDHHKDEKPCIQKDAKQELEGEVEISDQQSSELKRHVKRESENESLVTGDSSMNKKDDRSVAASAPAAKAPESTSS